MPSATVEFLPRGDKVPVRVSFEPETDNPVDRQRSGWQASLDTCARHASRA